MIQQLDSVRKRMRLLIFTIQGKSPVKIALNNEGQDAPAAPPDKIKNSDDFGWVCVIVPIEPTTRTKARTKQNHDCPKRRRNVWIYFFDPALGQDGCYAGEKGRQDCRYQPHLVTPSIVP